MSERQRKNNMAQRVEKILNTLDARYGSSLRCYLEYDEKRPWQLLFATILSAQCTDARVNIVTKELFKKYPTIEAFAEAKLHDMEEAVKTTGFYHNKAKNLIACARELLSRFDGEVPSSIEDLTSLPGVGRKTANVIRGNIYGIDSIVVDTHVKRVSKRLGLTSEEDPEKVEYDLMKVLPQDHWILWNLEAIAFGREICSARNPKCDTCPLQACCSAFSRHSESSS